VARRFDGTAMIGRCLPESARPTIDATGAPRHVRHRRPPGQGPVAEHPCEVLSVVTCACIRRSYALRAIVIAETAAS